MAVRLIGPQGWGEQNEPKACGLKKERDGYKQLRLGGGRGHPRRCGFAPLGLRFVCEAKTFARELVDNSVK
jgi:hypothetical protein